MAVLRPLGTWGLSLLEERRAGLCSLASPAAPQLWLRSLFARCSQGAGSRAGPPPWLLPQSSAGTCGHPHLSWACWHCSAWLRARSRPWNVPLFPHFLLLQTLWRFLRLRRRKTSGPTTEGMAEPDSRPSEPQEDDASSVTSSDFTTVSEEETAEGWAEADMGLAEGMATTNTHLEGIPETEAMPMLNVLAAVSNILQRLTTCTTVDAGLQMDIVSLTEEHPAHVVLSLLRCAPTCDGCTGHGTDAQLCSHRAAALMWRAIGTSEVATEEVLPALLSAIEEQPAYGGFFCSGDNKAVFARAATLALWRMAPMSEWHYAMLLHSPQLFVALLLQIVTSTEQTPGDVETQSFWRACQEEHGLPSEPNRFAVQTMKALLSSLGLDKKLVALEHTRVWEKLLCANTQHYAAGLLAREMRRGLTSLCPHMASHLLSLLIGKQARWHLPALAFFVELLECLDLSIHGPSALLVVSRQLPSECRDRLRLVLRGLTVLSKEPSLAGGIRGLYQRLVEQLADADAEMVRMTLSRLTDMLQDKGLKPPSLTLLKLAESLLPLVENDNSHVRLLSIQLFCQVMELVVEEGDDPLTTIREDESPSSISVLIQLAFERRSAGLCSSAESDVPESMGDFQLPLKMGAPAEQDAPAGAPGPALAAQS
ncbi:unnamed protein product [Coccothraustes coccothraustes]